LHRLDQSGYAVEHLVYPFSLNVFVDSCMNHRDQYLILCYHKKHDPNTHICLVIELEIKLNRKTFTEILQFCQYHRIPRIEVMTIHDLVSTKKRLVPVSNTFKQIKTTWFKIDLDNHFEISDHKEMN